MSKKYYSLENVQKKEIDAIIDSIDDSNNILKQPNKNIKKICGICHDCLYFRLVETEFEVIYVGCSELEIKLNLAKPITYCSLYRQRGQLELWEMKQIATIIEVPKEKVGFLK